MVAPEVIALCQAVVIHYVWIGVRRALGNLPPTTLSHPPRELERYRCSKVLLCVIAICTHELVIPYRTKVIEKYLGTLNSPIVLAP